MAQRRLQIDQETFNCSICLDLLTEPVTIPCGHSYCMSCVSTHWDGEVCKDSYSCPQCRHSFTWRPALVKNTMLAALVEDLSRSGLSVDHHVYAADGDVSCDLCSGKKLKALKSCLQCLVSYCEHHLQPHFDVGALKKHKLVEPTENLQENMCPQHHEVMKMFCCTDQECICYICSMDQHKGHDTVLALTKRNEMQQELEDTKEKIRQRLEQKQRQVDTLQRQTDSMVHSANTAVEDTDRTFRLISHLVETRRSQVKQHIRFQQEHEEHRVKELQDKVHQEMMDLKRTYKRLETLSQSEEHSAFINTLTRLSKLREDSETDINETAPLFFSDVLTAAVAELRHQLEDTSLLDQAVDLHSSLDSPPPPQVNFSTQTELLGPSASVASGDVLQTQEEPTTRAEFLAHARNISLDPNTAHPLLSVSAHNNIVRYMNNDQDPRDHPERFTDFAQVLTKEALSGRCYLEVKGRCGDYFSVVVAHKDIRREGALDECSFGNNDKSWALDCYKDGYVFWHNKVSSTLTAPPSNKIGIYVDSDAGLLSFYSVGQDMVLIHRVQSTFTEPLLVGVWLKDVADCAEICTLT